MFMKKLYFILCIVQLLCVKTIIAQNIAINDNGALPDTTAMLDVTSTTKGFLTPRMTTAQRNAIASPAQGLMVYCTNDSSFYYYSNGWNRLSKANESWSVKGNAGTDPVKHFIGTTDGAPLRFRVMHGNAGIIDASDGNTALGTKSLDSANADVTQNTAIGANALKKTTWGFYNTALGSTTGVNNTHNSGNTLLGAFADVSGPNINYSTAIGLGATVSQSNSIVLGNIITKTGIGVSAPISQLCNTDSNVIGTDNRGVNSRSLTWATQGNGFVMALYNRLTDSGTWRGNGLAVKIAGKTASNTLFDLSTGPQISAGKSVMIVKGNGNVGINKANPVQKLDVVGNAIISDSLGIGLTNPTAQLHLSNLVQNRKIVLYENVNNDHQFFGFGAGIGELRYQIPNTGSHIFYAGTSPSSSTELVRIGGNGYVGFGVSNPVTRLSNTTVNIIGSDGFGINTGSVTWDMNMAGYVQGLYNQSSDIGSNGLAVKIAGNTASNLVLDLSTGAQASTGTSIMQVRGNGNVSIGTTASTEKLSVNGAVKITDGGYGSITNNASAPVPAGGAGTLIFSNSHFFGWNGTAWKQLDN